MSNCLILSCFVQMQTPTKNSELYLFDHSWTPFQKRLYRYRPEMIILPNWSDRCLRCCVRGHFSNTCPLPQFPNNDLCMRCHAKVHLSEATCPNMDADMKDWACMTYMPTKSGRILRPAKARRGILNPTQLLLLQPTGPP